MKVSIITATYNSAQTLSETLASIKCQTHQDIEQIVIDGCSQDATLQIVAQYPSITKVLSEPDAGLYDAMSKGVKWAEGEVISILNSDDVYYDENVLKTVVDLFAQHPQVDAIYGNLMYFKTENPTKAVRYWRSRPYYPAFFKEGFAIPHPTLFVRKRVYDAVGYFRPDFKIGSDYEFMLRAFVKNHFVPMFVDQTFTRMRMGGESTKSLKNIYIGNKEIYESWQINQLKMPMFFFVKRLFIKLLQLNFSENTSNR